MAEEPVFLNFTKRKVKIRVPVSCWFDGKEFVEFEPQKPLTENVFNSEFTKIGAIGGINFSVESINDDCLPPEEENVYLIVPAGVARHWSLSGRADLVLLGPVLNKENPDCVVYDGLIVGLGMYRYSDKPYVMLD